MSSTEVAKIGIGSRIQQSTARQKIISILCWISVNPSNPIASGGMIQIRQGKMIGIRYFMNQL